MNRHPTDAAEIHRPYELQGVPLSVQLHDSGLLLQSITLTSQLKSHVPPARCAFGGASPGNAKQITPPKQLCRRAGRPLGREAARAQKQSGHADARNVLCSGHDGIVSAIPLITAPGSEYVDASRQESRLCLAWRSDVVNRDDRGCETQGEVAVVLAPIIPSPYDTAGPASKAQKYQFGRSPGPARRVIVRVALGSGAQFGLERVPTVHPRVGFRRTSRALAHGARRFTP